jgi:hypothetical protein
MTASARTDHSGSALSLPSGILFLARACKSTRQPLILFNQRGLKMATKAETPATDSKTGTDANTQVETKVVQTQPAEGAAQRQNVNVTGRSVFAVETTAAGVVVRTAFLTEDNRLLDMPAVFPDVIYALNVIDDLKRQVAQHFSQAAQVGAQVIANQARANQTAGESAGSVSISDAKTAQADTGNGYDKKPAA